MARGREKAAVQTAPVEGPWELPKGWRWERLDSFCTFQSGGKLKLNKSNYVESGYPAFSAAGQDGFVSVSEFNQPAVVLSSIGARCGKCFLAEGEWTSLANVYLIFPDDSIYTPKLLWYFLNDEKIWPRSGSAQPFIKPRDVQAMLVPVPPLETQRRIVARIDELFSELDDGETALARARQDLEVYRKALLKAAVTGELTADWRAANPPKETGEQLLKRILAERRARWEADPKNKGKRYKEPAAPDTSGLPALPEGWAWAALQQLAFISGGLTVDRKRQPEDPIELPYLRVANVQRGWLNLEEVKTIIVDRKKVPDLLLEKGDILLNEGGDRDKIGRGWVYQGQIDQCLHQNHVFKARPASALVSPYLISHYLNELGRQYFIDEGKQTTNLASISLSKVSVVPVAVPPVKEGQIIMQMIDSFVSKPNEPSELEALGEHSSFLRQSILAAAFKGELVQ